MISEIRTYIKTFSELAGADVKVEYLTNNVKCFSVNEATGYQPLIENDITGNKKLQFQFNFDAKLYWNEEVQNNIDNSIFFEKFKKWLDDNNKAGLFPIFQASENIKPESIEATTNGYIFMAEADEAIYRISCKFIYWKGDK